MQMKKVLLALTACVTVSAAFAQTPGGIRQAVSPDHYQAMPPSERQTYVAGVLDADRVFFQQTQPVFAACLNGVTLAQATDVVDKSLPTLKPELRSSMPLAVHNALIVACDRSGYKVQ
ncbi:hypothetical protein GNZ12_26810 [Paraburkholderia sp. 1N]|uniref:DUF732 domain-containing protein n=1 Tax=Paraburkholderia solitsugae TaxID=2675748 RepID=A0ABX2BXV6_9BURK|nr:hypothetical protein [Paraburkholderia solitsugae]NPT44863.1 hypothetical protein [Paraburkholderia solitsugae]